jgi:hypothetical protein
MRAIQTAAGSLLILASAWAGLTQPAGAVPRDGAVQSRTGTVASIDSVSMNFVLSGGGMGHTFWVSRSTIFGGRARASLFDLRSGQRVRVEFHNSGGNDVADAVIF